MYQSYQEYLASLKGYKDFDKIEKVVKNNLYLFLTGEVCGLTYQEPIKTKPTLVLSYLHIFISEGIITNEQINEELQKIPVNIKEYFWLLLEYIEAQLLYSINSKKDDPKLKREHLVNIDIEYLKDKMKNAWDSYKNDYTVKYILKEIFDKTGVKLFS